MKKYIKPKISPFFKKDSPLEEHRTVIPNSVVKHVTISVFDSRTYFLHV